MTPKTVAYTGLELDPTVLRERCIKGVIPPAWQRYRFALGSQVTYPVNKVNRWLQNNIESSWAVYCSFTGTRRVMVIAFEQDGDAMTFVMADGKTQAFREIV